MEKIKKYIKENKVKNFFFEGLKERTIEQKYQYIKNHFQYFTMNSWNQTKSIANNVKIYNLGLTNEQQDNFFTIENIDPYIIWDYLNYEIKELAELTNSEIFFNGRSDGYIVMKLKNTYLEDIIYFENYKEFKKEQKQFSYYDNSYKEEIEELYFTIKAFDKLCDVLRSNLIYILDNYQIEEHEENYTKTIKSIII